MSVKKLYSYEVIKGTSIHEAEHYRISDPEDNRIGTCYLPENAKRIVDALNASLQCERCNGTGKVEKACSMCCDSTYDHVCDDGEVDCWNCKGTGVKP